MENLFFCDDKVSVVCIVELKRTRMKWQQTTGVTMALVLGRALSFVPASLNAPSAGLRRALCASSSLGEFSYVLYVRTD